MTEGANEILSQGVALNGCIPSDAIVCLWSAHARAGIFGGPVPALRDKIAWTSKRGFNHGNAGTADQPIRSFMDLDVFPRLTDSFDARLQAPIVLNPPMEQSTGSIAADIRVEYNAFTHSVFGVVPVVYAYYLERTSGGVDHGTGQVEDSLGR